MKEIQKNDDAVIFQGDIMIRRVNAMPSEAKRLDGDVVAHSETGHNHTAANMELFGLDPMTMFIRATGDHIDIVHHREFDTHEPLRLYSDPGDVFIIRRQREHTPDGWRRVED